MVPRLACLSLLIVTGLAEAAPLRPATRLEMSRARLEQPLPAGSVMVVNRGTKPLLVLQVAAVTAGSWGPDRLGSGSLPPGGRGILRLGSSAGCLHDLRATFAHGGELTRFNLDICASPEVTLTDEDLATPLPPTREGLILYRITNRSGRPVVALHASPAGGAQRSDMLGAWVMAETMHYTGRAPALASCRFDLRSAFSLRPQDATIVEGLDLCQSREVSLPVRGAAEALSN